MSEAGRLQRQALTDAELLAASLQIEDPRTLVGLSLEPPDPEQSFQLSGEYHLPKDDPGLRCSYCPTHTKHRNGFVVSAGDCHHFLGSTCGPKHFGLSFTQSRTELNAQRARQSTLRNLLIIAERREELVAACDKILFSDELRAVENARAALATIAPDLLLGLRSSVIAGSPLQEFVQVRDFQAEARREGNSTQPIYRGESVSLGPVEGTVLVSNIDPRQTIHAFKAVLAELHAYLKADTNAVSLRALRSELIKIEKLHEAANTTISDCNRAHQFFSQRNRDRLERWSATRTAEKFLTLDGRLIVDTAKEQKILTPIGRLGLPTLPLLIA